MNFKKNLLFLLVILLLFTIVTGEVGAFTWRSSPSTYRSSNSNNSVFRFLPGNSSDNTRTSQPSVLEYGSQGTEVRNMQEKLHKLGYNLNVSGFYDRNTTIAVMYFQRDNSLSITGKIDASTRNRINSVYEAKFASPTPPAPEPTPPTPKPSPPSEPGQPQEPGEEVLEAQMLNLINQERTKRGLSPLQMDNRIVHLARKKSKDMIDNNYFAHNSPTYGSPFKMLNDAGIRYRTAAENIAGNRTVSGAHTALMNSAGHQRNILNPAFSKIGIGIVKGGPYGMMFTQIFIGE